MDSSPLILHIAVPVPLPRLFDYRLPADYCGEMPVAGMRVKIPFGKRLLMGVIVKTSAVSTFPVEQLKMIVEVLDTQPLFSPTIFALLQWASDYYHAPIGEVFATALPVLLRKGKDLEYKIKTCKQSEKNTVALMLNQYQQAAVENVIASFQQFKTFLLDGVTGSGKTEVYLQVIAGVLAQNKQALILVPEIGLTPQITERFQQRFSATIVILHSGMTDRARLNAWLQARDGTARIIIGTRSAVFTPLENLGVIIVDEEHDLSFKQHDGFRYHARDLAVRRAQLENIPIILGSATPALETIHNARENRYQYLHLPERVGNAKQPLVHVLDLRNKKIQDGLSPELINRIRLHLSQNGQILLFLNRRGFAPVLICNQCAWVAACKRCDAKMTLHQHGATLLQCHHCGAQRPPDRCCPECSNKNLMPLGLGTQRLEQTLQKHFPDIGIVRIDRDSTRKKGSFEAILQTIHNGENKILIGTQMLAKGHHFPDVTLAAILNADNGLFSNDFRATERMAQLILQVAGRAGREEKSGEVVIQTHHPENPMLQLMLQQDYSKLAELILAERQAVNFPPHAYFAVIRAEAVDKTYPLDFLTAIKHHAKKINLTQVKFLGPIPSLMERKAGRYRAQLLLQASKRSELHQQLKVLLPAIEKLPEIRKVRWHLDIDPQEVV